MPLLANATMYSGEISIHYNSTSITANWWHNLWSFLRTNWLWAFGAFLQNKQGIVGWIPFAGWLNQRKRIWDKIQVIVTKSSSGLDSPIISAPTEFDDNPKTADCLLMHRHFFTRLEARKRLEFRGEFMFNPPSLGSIWWVVCLQMCGNIKRVTDGQTPLVKIKINVVLYV